MLFKRIMWKIRDWRFERRMAKQRYKKGYADCDCWGMHYWFSSTFPKMVLRLRDMKHGYPDLPFEEVENFPLQWVNETALEIAKQKAKVGYEESVILTDTFDRWQLVLSRIAWCFQQADEEITEIENEYEEEYHKQVWGEDTGEKDWFEKHWVVEDKDSKGKPKTYRLVTNEPDKELSKKYWDKCEEIAKYRDDCKNEAFDLLKKYFWNLWD